VDIDDAPPPIGPLPRYLTARYLRIVKRHAERLRRKLPTCVEFDELVGAGHLGLADALSKYGRLSEERFERYVGFRVRGAMIDELRSSDPLSHRLRDLSDRIVGAVRQLTAELGRIPEDDEVAWRLDLPLEALRKRLAAVSFGGLVSLDARDDEGAERLEIADDSIEAADAHVARRERNEELARALERLPEKLQLVIRLRYTGDYNFREVGEVLGVTESRVSQLHTEAIAMLRAAYARRDAAIADTDDANVDDAVGDRPDDPRVQRRPRP
jgi:RNA polymerase sigma factor for flagellar operon FliA